MGFYVSASQPADGGLVCLKEADQSIRLQIECIHPVGGKKPRVHFPTKVHLLNLPEGVLEHVNLGLVADSVHHHLRRCVCVGSSSLVYDGEDHGMRLRVR